MTLAEQLRNEGYRRGTEVGKEQWLQQGMQQGMQQGIQQGIQQGMQQGIQQGIQEGIEIAIKLKFENESDCEKVMALIRQIKDVDRLKALEHAIKEARTASELIDRINA